MLAPIGSTLLISLIFQGPAPDAGDAPPPKAELARRTDRGRMLAGYDNAAWRASDAVVALKPAAGSIERYIARKGEKGWVVAFGKLDPAKESFLVAYEATEGEGDAPDAFAARKVDPPRAEAGFVLSAARAQDVAIADFVTAPPERRPYNVAAIPGDGDEVLVYAVPAQTEADRWPIGGDIRYRVSADGRTILAREPLHRSVIERDNRGPGGNVLVAGVHSHVLDGVPGETDVFYVLAHKPAIPEMIVSARSVYQVDKDGTIIYVGKAEDVLKKK